MDRHVNPWRGLALGTLGVLIFSLTLPMTRIAVAELDAAFVALGRAVIAGVCAAGVLAATRAPRPTRAQWRGLACVSAGVVFGFPLLSSWAMRHVPAAHGAVVNGLLPIATALCAMWFARERPGAAYWACALAGSALVTAFALRHGTARIGTGDWAMLGAVAAGGIGYAAGGRLAQTMGGVNVICWALVLSLPLLAPLAAWRAFEAGIAASPRAWLGFGYTAVMSQLIGFFFWYRGLALGGVARVGQVQLLQPFLTVLFAAWVASEPLEASTLAFAAAVIATVAIGQRARIRTAPPAPGAAAERV